MNRTDDLMREAHILAERIRHGRATRTRTGPGADDGLAALEARLRALWGEIRAVRAAATTTDLAALTHHRTRPKWD